MNDTAHEPTACVRREFGPKLPADAVRMPVIGMYVEYTDELFGTQVKGRVIEQDRNDESATIQTPDGEHHVFSYGAGDRLSYYGSGPRRLRPMTGFVTVDAAPEKYLPVRRDYGDGFAQIVARPAPQGVSRGLVQALGISLDILTARDATIAKLRRRLRYLPPIAMLTGSFTTLLGVIFYDPMTAALTHASDVVAQGIFLARMILGV